MKSLIILLLLITPALSQQKEVKEASSAESMAALRESWKGNRKSKLKRASIEVQVRESNKDFMATSVYFVGARGFTVLPKGSVLTSGRSFKEVNDAPEDLPYMDWAAFVRTHRAGLLVHAVTSEQLQFGKSLKGVNDAKARCLKGGIACVTTYKLNPVRVAKEAASESLAKVK